MTRSGAISSGKWSGPSAGESRGSYQLAEGGCAGSIARGDLAAALLDVLEDPTRFRRASFASG